MDFLKTTTYKNSQGKNLPLFIQSQEELFCGGEITLEKLFKTAKAENIQRIGIVAKELTTKSICDMDTVNKIAQNYGLSDGDVFCGAEISIEDKRNNHKIILFAKNRAGYKNLKYFFDRKQFIWIDETDNLIKKNYKNFICVLTHNDSMCEKIKNEFENMYKKLFGEDLYIEFNK